MGVSNAIWIGCEDMGLDSAVSDKQELHYAHSDNMSNAAGVQKENKNRAPDARHVPPKTPQPLQSRIGRGCESISLAM
jgi:hypothetical protein